MLGWILLLVGWTAALLNIAISWIVSYFPVRMNYCFIISAFAAALTTAGIGVIVLVFNFISWLLGLIF